MDNDNNAILILMNSGDGTFAAPVPYQVGNSPGSLISADFNSDGIIDLAAANLTDGSISVLIGKGAGAFNSAATSTGGDTRGNDADMVWADFNHDGKPDLLISYSSTNCFSLLLGKGDGNFQPSVDYITTAEPFSEGVLPLDDGTLMVLTRDALTGEVDLSRRHLDVLAPSSLLPRAKRARLRLRQLWEAPR